MDQYEIAEALREIAWLVDFLDTTPFRSIAYRKAANTVESAQNFEEMMLSGDISSLPGIGKEISKIILILFNKQPFPYLEKLRQEIPESVFDLFSIPKLGKRRAKSLYQKFQIKSIDELEKALKEGVLLGFREATISQLLKSIKKLRVVGKQVLWQEGMKIALSLGKTVLPQSIEIVGQLRRKLELISHIELLLESPGLESLDRFSTHSFVKEIVYIKNSKIRVYLKQGIIADLIIIPQENWTFGLLYHTGSKKHIKELKQESVSLGIPFHQKYFKNIKNEKDLYQLWNMQFIYPELREGMGEIDAAKKHILPNLLQEEDIRGVFHCHTTDSDGTNSIEEMALLAKERGWEYLGISDHSQSSSQAHGLSVERLFQQIETIKILNSKLSPFRIFSGIECDILKNGDLDFSDDVLKHLDFVIVSVHSFFRLHKKEMTKRIIKAVENPYTTMLGHVSGRLLRHRDPYQIDILKIIDACAHNHKIIELNSTPSRLDMDWRYWHIAKQKGVRCAINPDAHSIRDFKNYILGVHCARKGWLEKQDVINTFDLKGILNFLKDTRARL